VRAVVAGIVAGVVAVVGSRVVGSGMKGRELIERIAHLLRELLQ
jgi:hypothetical protein